MDIISTEPKTTDVTTEQKFQEKTVVISVAGIAEAIKEDEQDVNGSSSSDNEVETSEESSTSSEDETLHEIICSVPNASEPSSVIISSPQTNDSTSFTTVPTKKTKKISLTRLQENDLLLSIYDSISAYRRPSSKPSHTRKIDAIDATISLLQKLKEQLLSSENETNSSAASSSSTSSPSHTKSTKKKDASKSSSSEKPDQVQKKAQSKEKSPKRPFDLFFLEERQKMESMSEVQAKEQCTADWKRMPPSLQEPYFSRFSRLYEQIPAPSQKPEDLTTSFDPGHRMERAVAPDSLPSIVKFHPWSNSPSPIESTSIPWRISKNPQVKAKPNSPFDIEQFEALFSLSLSSPFVSLAISQNGGYIALSTKSNAYLYMTELTTPKNEPVSPNSTSPPAVPISASKKLKLTCVGAIPVSHKQEVLTRTTCLDIDGSFFYSLDMDNYLRKWDVKSGKLEIQVKASDHFVWALKISNDGNLLATSSDDCHVMVWDAKTLTPVFKLGSNGNKKLGPSKAIFCVSFSPCSSMVACGSLDGTIRIWRLSDGILLARFDGHTKEVTAIVWENSNQLISTSPDCSIRRWSLTAKSPLSSLFCTQQDPMIAMNVDRRQILWGGGKSKSLKCWPLISLESTSTEIKDDLLLQPILAVLGHTESITDIAVADLSLSEDEPSTTATLMASLDAKGKCSLWMY